MTTDFWAEDLPTFSFISPRQRRSQFWKAENSKNWAQTFCQLCPRGPAPHPCRTAGPWRAAAHTQHSEAGVSLTTPVWPGWDEGAFRTTEVFCLELRKNPEIGHTPQTVTIIHIWWWKKKSPGDQNKTKPWEAPRQGQLHNEGQFLAMLVFMVFLKQLNIRRKGEHFGWILYWFSKDSNVGGLWDLDWK